MYYFMLFALLIFSIGGLVFSILAQTDGRVGRRWNDLKNGRGRNGPKKGYVKPNSILRKLPFKDTDYNPLLYIKIVPVVIHFIIFLVAVAMYILLWIFPDTFEPILTSYWCLGVSLAIGLAPMIYEGILSI